MFQDQRIVWGNVVLVIVGLGVIGYAGDGLGEKRSRRRQQNRRSPGPDKSHVQTLAGYDP
jgi:hypothetical protein